jgi:hypothetical protein
MWPEASSHGAGGSHAVALAAGNDLVFLVAAALGLAVATAGLLLPRAAVTSGGRDAQGCHACDSSPG